MSSVNRSFYYYDVDLFDFDKTGNTMVKVKNQEMRFNEIFSYIKDINDQIGESSSNSEKKRLQEKIEFPTSDGDKIYVIVDKINDDNIRYRLILCRKNALPLVEKDGILTFLTDYLPKDFSLAEITHCVLFQKDGIMGAEYNYAGARAKYIADYLSFGLKKIPFVTCRPKINEKAFEKIIDGEPYGYFLLSVKNSPEMRAELSKRQGVFSALLHCSENVDEYEICLKRRITKKKDGFEGLLTKSEMEEFVKNHKEGIKQFKVSQGAKKDAIDLINDKFVCTSNFVQTNNKSIDADEAYGVIISYYGSVVKDYK